MADNGEDTQRKDGAHVHGLVDPDILGRLRQERSPFLSGERLLHGVPPRRPARDPQRRQIFLHGLRRRAERQRGVLVLRCPSELHAPVRRGKEGGGHNRICA